MRLGFVAAIASSMSGAACTDDSTNSPGFLTEATAIEVTTETTPALIAFRDGLDGAWQTPIATGDARYELLVHGPYIVAVVCRGDQQTVTQELARTPDDGDQVDASCPQALGGTIPVDTASVTGTMAQPGQVAVGRWQDESEAANWGFNIATIDGQLDVIARSAQRGVIYRDVTVSGSTILDRTVDPDADGLPLVDLPMTLTNLPPNNLHVDVVFVDTPTTTIDWLAGIWPDVIHNTPAIALQIMPDAALRPTDTQYVRVFEFEDRSFNWRLIDRKLNQASPPELTLPSAFDDLRFSLADGQVVGTWSNAPELDTLELMMFGTVPNRSEYIVVQSAKLTTRFLEATQVTSATLHTDIPGYDPTWRLDVAGEYHCLGEATKQSSDDQLAISHVGIDSCARPQAKARRTDSAGLDPWSVVRAQRTLRAARLAR